MSKNKITGFQKFMMHCVIVQFFKFISYNIKILKVVAKGHGGTRD